MAINYYQGNNSLLEDLSGEKEQIEAIKNKISELFNMKNIHFLFGSGTSAGAIPTMAGLYKKVKEKIEKCNDDKQTEFNEIVSNVEGENLEEILGVLYSHRIYLENKNDEDKLNICINLIKTIENVIFSEINIDISDSSKKDNLDNYKRFYSKVSLRNKDLSRINVFTTNNDLFNETALDSLNIHYINGFNSGLNRYFNPALFNYTYAKRMDTSIDKFEPVENLVHLYKIHGSVNWVEDDSNQNSFFKIKEIFDPKIGSNNVLIYPTPTKQDKSLGSPYVEMFREFQKKLLEPLSVLFVIGYSFSDEHVNNIIYQALATNTTLNVVILNDVDDKTIGGIEDNRIFKIWGEMECGDKIHYFNNIVDKLLPDVNAFRSENNSLNEFIKIYKQNIEKK